MGISRRNFVKLFVAGGTSLVLMNIDMGLALAGTKKNDSISDNNIYSVRSWYGNGQQYVEGSYENNQKHGKWTTWSRDGCIKSIE